MSFRAALRIKYVIAPHQSLTTDMANSGPQGEAHGENLLGPERCESRSLLRSPWPWPCLSAGCIEGDRGTDERLERTRFDLLPLMDVNRAPYVPVEARVEELGRVLQRSPLGEGQLHDRLVRLRSEERRVGKERKSR